VPTVGPKDDGDQLVRKRSRFAVLAEKWLRDASPDGFVTTADLWLALSKADPDLTTPCDTRKTPRATCMRDLRKDSSFEIGGGKVRLRRS
jgi:hypothetical protein